MILPDINILVYAHRLESPFHQQGAKAIEALASSFSPFALTSHVISGFVRLVTNSIIFEEPTSLEEALLFIENLVSLNHCHLVEPGEKHWPIFQAILREASATGNLVSDAYLAAIAVENGCTLLTNDTDFRKFPDLKIEKL